MEVRRRSLSSEYEFRERRTTGRKKRGALPLAMVLSFNDKDVHPDCPNVSNPYHKCGRHCIDKIPTGQNFLDAIRSGGDQEWDKKSEKRGVNPNCPYASNPYHKCAGYCSGKLSEKPEDAGKDKPGVNPKKEVFTTEKEVKPECIYASNPYHVCAECCVPIVPEKDQPRQSTRLKGSREGEKVLIARHASNPNQECAESCLQIATDRNVADREKHKGAPKKTNKGSVHLNRNASSHNNVAEYFFEDAPKKEHLKEDMKSKKENEIGHTTQLELSSLCKNASKADHVCDDYCFQSVPEREQYGQVIKLESSKEGEKVMSNNIESTAAKPKEESEIIVTVEQVVNLAYKNAPNPSDVRPEYCSESVPEREQHEQIIRLESKKEGDKFLNNRHSTGFDPCCKLASNPHHECTEFCFKNTPDRNLAEEAIKPKDKSKIVVAEKGVNLEHKSASNPDYVPAEYGFHCVLEREQHRPKKTKGLSFKIDKSKALPDNKQISNSYHEVNDDCFDYNPPNGAMKPKEERIIVTTEQRVDLVCKYASNPYHECTEYCFQNLPNEDQRRKVLTKSMEKEEAVVPLDRVNPQCKQASNPYHVCAEYCFPTVPEKDRPGQSTRPKGSKEGEKVVSTKRACSPNHEYAESCFQIVDRNIAKGEKPKGAPKKTNKAMKPKEEGIVVTAERGVDLVCKYASNPYHECTECCFQNLPNEDQGGKAITKSMEKEVGVVPLERVNLQCKLASNPYHVCAEYCFQNVSNGHHPVRSMMTSKEKKEVVLSPQVVNLECKYSSNPYHVCAEYCFKNVLERDPPRPTIKKLKEEDAAVLPSERQVSPECKFASNPYHVCAEYCVKNALEGEQQGQVMKLESLKELKGLVNNKKITSGHPQCEYSSNPYHQCAENCFNKNVPASKIPDRVVKRIERKKEKSYSPRRDDNPKYKNASNSLHRCPDYCSEETSPTSEIVEGSTATIKMKKRNSSKGNKRNHPIVEKISLKSRYMEASKPGQNYVESSERIILHDGTEKSSMDFKYAGAFNPTNHNFNLNNGIFMYMQYETKDLQSAKMVDIRNPKEPTDAPPLHIDASDLFNEWAKYCSQSKVAEDEIVKQEKKVGIGEVSTRNGKANSFLKDYDAANLEKVQATVGFPRSSLPILLLFLLGFLLALLHWARVIHSLVISSEKHEEPERMKHERHLDPKCKKVSDPCHKFSHYCFPGVDDEIQ